MSCYFRHLREIFKMADIHVTNENKRNIDKVIHNMVHVEYKNCSLAWREVKKRITEDEEDFVSRLKEEWNSFQQETN